MQSIDIHHRYYIKFCQYNVVIYIFIYTYGKNSFTEISKTLTRYGFENNFVWTIKIIT